MTAITFKTLVTRLARYAGRAGVCDDDEEAKAFAIEILEEYLSVGGEKGGLHKWAVKVCDNCITLPPDLAVPLKIKTNCESGIVSSEWYEFYDRATEEECHGCAEEGVSLQMEVNTFPTVYDLPCNGARVVAEMSLDCPVTVKGNDIPHVTIQGTCRGNDVWTTYKGKDIHGERLDLLSDKLVRSLTIFDRISQVTISKTPGFKTLWAQVDGADKLSLLARYNPSQTIGMFRRAKIMGVQKNSTVVILGRVQVRDSYADNDIVPVTNMSAMIRLAKSRQSEENSNYAGAAFSMQRAEKNINDKNDYERQGQDDPFDIIAVTAPSAFHNYGGFFGHRRRRW